jgi:putative heme transporter
MFAPEQTASEIALPALDARLLLRRVAVPAVLACAAVGALFLAGGRVHAVTAVLRRGFGQGPGWVGLSALLEAASLAAYVWLLSLVAGRASPRIGTRESARITLAGAAATRLLPTAGAGGAALTVWALRRTGLAPRMAARTLLVFLVVLYGVFLAAIAVAGGALSLGLVPSPGPVALSAIPAAGAIAAITTALVLACRRRAAEGARSRLMRAADLLAEAVRDACRLVRAGDPRLAGAVGYWAFDAAVLWAMLHAFGAAPALPVVVLAYFVGQVSNTVPLPGSVSGGMTGVLVAFGVPFELALPSVLTYRTLAVWLPLPVAVAAVPGLRASVARWEHEDAAATAGRG